MNASDIALLATHSLGRSSVLSPFPRVRIIARRNGVGLDRDVSLLRTAMPRRVEIDCYSPRSLMALKGVTEFGGTEGPLNILVERIPFSWSYANGTNILIPNQERFPRRHLPRLHRLDMILCKSKHAQQVFQKHFSATRYIGFTSVDRKLAGRQPDYRRFLHLAGRSTLKGTGTVLQLWREHPEWPTLTLIQHAPGAKRPALPNNVRYIDHYVNDQELRKIQNEHGINLCPSLSEGWGHYIVEGMSCGSVTITTDAPPMNEVVNESRGILVPWNRATQRHLGTNFTVDIAELEKSIVRVLDTPEERLAEIGTEARNWFLWNGSSFRNRMTSVLNEVLADHQ